MSKRKDKSLAVPTTEGEETVSVQIRKPLMDAVMQAAAEPRLTPAATSGRSIIQQAQEAVANIGRPLYDVVPSSEYLAHFAAITQLLHFAANQFEGLHSMLGHYELEKDIADEIYAVGDAIAREMGRCVWDRDAMPNRYDSAARNLEMSTEHPSIGSLREIISIINAEESARLRSAIDRK